MTNIDTQRLPIGVFDSGVGGLSVLKVLQEQFPNENFIYIGDNANNPVGNRPTEEITEIRLPYCRNITSSTCKIDGYRVQLLSP